MFKNVQIRFATETALQLSWDWEYDDPAEVPKCSVFYCGVPENRLLEKGLFLENEIMAYFNEQVVKIFASNAREEMAAYNLRNTGTSRLNKFQQGNHFQENKQLPIPSGTENNIFLVCIFDDNDMVFRVIAGGSQREIGFDLEKKGFFQKLMGSGNRQTVVLRCNDTRQKVIATRKGKRMLYSVLPEGQTKLYFDENVDLTNIKIYYLSSLIGKSGIGAD